MFNCFRFGYRSFNISHELSNLGFIKVSPYHFTIDKNQLDKLPELILIHQRKNGMIKLNGITLEHKVSEDSASRGMLNCINESNKIEIMGLYSFKENEVSIDLTLMGFNYFEKLLYNVTTYVY